MEPAKGVGVEAQKDFERLVRALTKSLTKVGAAREHIIKYADLNSLASYASLVRQAMMHKNTAVDHQLGLLSLVSDVGTWCEKHQRKELGKRWVQLWEERDDLVITLQKWCSTTPYYRDRVSFVSLFG
jgi:hypothetical protein